MSEGVLSVLFYFLVFAVVFVIQLFAMRQKNTFFKRFLILMSFLVILLLIGLRYRVGTDYDSYVSMYNDYTNGVIYGDAGARLIFGLSSKFSMGARTVFWIYGALALYPIYKINKNSDFKYLAYSTLIYNLVILPFCLNCIRQGAAVSFALLAFDYLRNDSKIWKVVLSVVIAIILHKSAILLIPFFVAFVFSRRRQGNFSLYAYAITALLSISLVTFLKSFLANIGFLEYNNYLSVLDSGNNTFERLIYQASCLIPLVILFLLYDRCKNNKEEVADTKDMLSMVVSGSVLDLVGSATRFLSRISFYFSAYQILLIPVLLQNIENKNTRLLAKLAYTTAIAFLFIMRCYVWGSYDIIPYQTWLFSL